MAFTVAQAKSLCTAGELSLVKASTRNEIGKLSVVQVRQKVDRARNLRDKWRDQSRDQRRATQSKQRSRETGANARSGEKATLFGEVLARTVEGEPGEYVTLFAVHGPAEGVRTHGLRFPLVGERLEPGSSRGVSNELTGHTARVELDAGVLLAVLPGPSHRPTPPTARTT